MADGIIERKTASPRWGGRMSDARLALAREPKREDFTKHLLQLEQIATEIGDEQLAHAFATFSCVVGLDRLDETGALCQPLPTQDEEALLKGLKGIRELERDYREFAKR